jgi:hypothetical protein
MHIKKLSRYGIPGFAQNQRSARFLRTSSSRHGGFYDLARADLRDKAEISCRNRAVDPLP